MVKVSVVVPSNHLDLDIDKILKWAIKLNPETWEMIFVIDELYRDFTSEIKVLKGIQTGLNLKIVRGKFGNPGDARNIGLKNTTGTWIIFWDSDDLPNANATYEMIMDAERAGAGVAIGAFTLKPKATKKKFFSPVKKSQIGIIAHVTMNPGIWRFCFRREIISENRFPSLRMGEDQVFLATLNFSKISILLSSKNVYEYDDSNLNSLTKDPVALLDLQETIAKLTYSVQRNETNRLGIFLLLKMIGTLTFSSKCRHQRILSKTEVDLVANATKSIIKDLIRRNSGRLRVIK